MKEDYNVWEVHAKNLQSKVAVQRNEIARLTQVVEKLMEDKRKLIEDIKWMRGE